MNVKVVLIVVAVVLVALAALPLVMGAVNGNLGQPKAEAIPNTEWHKGNLPGTTWAGSYSQKLPDIIAKGVTINVDATVLFMSDGTFTVSPIINVTGNAPEMMKVMTEKMKEGIPPGKWSLNYPVLTLTMTDPEKPEAPPKSVDAKIGGNMITSPNLFMAGAPDIVLSRQL